MSSSPRNPSPSNTVLLWLSETALLFACYVLAAFLWGEDVEFYLFYDGGLVQILLVTAFIQIGLWLEMLYSSPWTKSRVRVFLGLARILGAAFLFQALWFYLDPAVQIPRAVMFYGSLLALVALTAWRMLFFSLQERVADNVRLLLVGDSPVVKQLAKFSKSPFFPFSIASVLDTTASGGLSADQLDSLIETSQPTHVVITGNPSHTRGFLNLQWSGLQVVEAAEFYERTFRRVPIEELQPGDFLFSNAFYPDSSSAFSVLTASLLALLSLPLAIPLALAIRLATGDTVLVRSPRQGRRGRPFELIQFRVPANPGNPAAPSWLGRWITKFRLHRLPELLNVIRGEMAFLGPRPLHCEIAARLEAEIPLYRHRNSVRPGMFGWAQLNLPNLPVDPLEEVAYDLYYIKHRDLLLNVYILGHSLNTTGAA